MNLRKHERQMAERLKELLGKKALLAQLPRTDDPAADWKLSLFREVRLSGDRIAYLSDSGYKAFIEVINGIDLVLKSEGNFEYKDLAKTCRSILGDFYSFELDLSGWPSFVDECRRRLDLVVKVHSIFVALEGVHLDGVDLVKIGHFKIMKAEKEIIDSCTTTDALKSSTWSRMNHKVWMTAEFKGTFDFCQKYFVEQSKLISAILAVAVATVDEWGSSNLRVEPQIEGCGMAGSASWFAFPNDTKTISLSSSWGRKPPIHINQAAADFLMTSDWIEPLALITFNPPVTELHEALRRALYWFYDAQADAVNEMQLVKYWSCIECFFSFEKEAITLANERGLLALLVCGGYGFVEPEKHQELRKNIGRLYELRSTALHDAQHGHVTQRDVANISKWAAGVIITVTALTLTGYSTRAEIKEQSDRIANRMILKEL